MAGHQLRSTKLFDGPNAGLMKSVTVDVRAQNAATYMMANQPPLLGLTFIPPEYSYAQPTESFRQVIPVGVGDQIMAMSGEPSRLTPVLEPRVTAASTEARIDALKLNCQQTPLACFSQYSKAASLPNPLQVVAFSDTDDLLSWPLPKPFADKNIYLDINPTNVFVQNAPRWFGKVENPSKAHSGYFTNDSVRHVIICGAKGQALEACE